MTAATQKHLENNFIDIFIMKKNTYILGLSFILIGILGYLYVSSRYPDTSNSLPENSLEIAKISIQNNIIIFDTEKGGSPQDPIIVSGLYSIPGGTYFTDKDACEAFLLLNFPHFNIKEISYTYLPPKFKKSGIIAHIKGESEKYIYFYIKKNGSAKFFKSLIFGGLFILFSCLILNILYKLKAYKQKIN